jgi:Aminoglycoside-2''-adenylyltransferase
MPSGHSRHGCWQRLVLGVAEGKSGRMLYDPENHTWEPLSVAEIGPMFSAGTARWWLSGGWAIDHWLGITTRRHGDIDISTLRPDLPALLAHLPPQLRPYAAIDGQLVPLSDVEDPRLHNIWVLDVHRDRWILQINLEEGDQALWRYRRDTRITLPWDRAVGLVGSLPTGTPAVQLLWKSRGPRPQDEHDLDITHGALHPDERRWLREAVRTAHPESPWIGDPRLAGASSARRNR